MTYSNTLITDPKYGLGIGADNEKYFLSPGLFQKFVLHRILLGIGNIETFAPTKEMRVVGNGLGLNGLRNTLVHRQASRLTSVGV
jgi:hypothetical protein